MLNKQFKNLPSVSEVISELDKKLDYDNRILTLWINRYLSDFRFKAKNGNLKNNRIQIIEIIVKKVLKKLDGNFRSLINGTGIVLHTGLGRAPLEKKIIEKSLSKLYGYSNLEYDLISGKRGNRQSHLDDYFQAFTGSESSLIVNNNAAAVLLGINSISYKKEVVVSRGQEVEIGGSFRIPDIIEKSGAILKEIGTTNRTHISDIYRGINSKTGLLLWVHTSNYRIQGFTKDLSLEDMISVGKEKGIPVMADLGSGALEDFSSFGLPVENTVNKIVDLGPDIITFSGDKLLGGPQSGIILGGKEIISKCSQNSIYRTVRCDKFKITLLEEILSLIAQKKQYKYNLAIKLLSTNRNDLKKRIKKLLKFIPKDKIKSYNIKMVDTEVEAGSGSLPVRTISSAAIVMYSKKNTSKYIAEKFRSANIPIIGYINKNQFFIDFKAILPFQDKIVKTLIIEIL